jgi:hypothetical protein
MPKATAIMKFMMKTADIFLHHKTGFIWVSFQIVNLP